MNIYQVETRFQAVVYKSDKSTEDGLDGEEIWVDTIVIDGHVTIDDLRKILAWAENDQ